MATEVARLEVGRMTSCVIIAGQCFDLENEQPRQEMPTGAVCNHIQYKHVDVNLQEKKAADAAAANISHF